jgi:hypothetical protein
MDGSIMLKLIFKKWNGGHGMDWSGPGTGQVVGSYERGNEISASMEFGEFLD